METNSHFHQVHQRGIGEELFDVISGFESPANTAKASVRGVSELPIAS